MTSLTHTVVYQTCLSLNTSSTEGNDFLGHCEISEDISTIDDSTSRAVCTQNTVYTHASSEAFPAALYSLARHLNNTDPPPLSHSLTARTATLTNKLPAGRVRVCEYTRSIEYT